MIKIKPLHALMTLMVLFILFNGINSVASAAEVYAQLSNTDSQITNAANINKPTVVVLEDVNNISGMDWDPKQNILTIKKDGVYTISSGIQAGTRQFARLDSAGGDFNFWLEANGNVLPDSSNWVHVSPHSKSNAIGNDFLVPLTAGTQIRFMFSTTIANIGIITFRGTELRPASPGITVSLRRIGDIPVAAK
jgi:hypothetical protein